MPPPRRESIGIDMRVEGARETLEAFKALPKEANNRLREAALRLSELLAARVRTAGAAEGRQAALLVTTVKAKRDRIPSITVGGTKALGRAWPKRGRAKAFELLFGSEFGASTGHGFKPHRGQQGYWIFPTVEASQAEIGREWLKAADDIVLAFVEGE
jgi:hypothetical protein